MNDAQPASPPRNAGLIASLGHGFNGWRILIAGTPNARIHAAIAIAALAMGLWLEINLTEWAIIGLTMGMVFTAECFNTALETAVDLASPEVHPLAKIAKDVSAGGVLFAATASVAVGLLVFGPPLWARLSPIIWGGR